MRGAIKEYMVYPPRKHRTKGGKDLPKLTGQCGRAGLGLSPLTPLLYKASSLSEDGFKLPKIYRPLKDYCFELWTYRFHFSLES